MPGPTTSQSPPCPGCLKLPARFDRCLLPELTPDGRLVYYTDALEYVLVSRCGLTRAQAGAWLLEVTTDTRPGTPDFLD